MADRSHDAARAALTRRARAAGSRRARDAHAGRAAQVPQAAPAVPSRIRRDRAGLPPRHQPDGHQGDLRVAEPRFRAGAAAGLQAAGWRQAHQALLDQAPRG
eukprot:1085537-Prymnesium_polylepis.1